MATGTIVYRKTQTFAIAEGLHVAIFKVKVPLYNGFAPPKIICG